MRRGAVRILLAEDNITNQQVVLGILKKLGLRADAVANGEETVKALETLPYDLVLMDVQMPEMDGLEATRKIRNPQSAVRNHHIPIIAMTAHAMQGDRERCMKVGMNDYVTKPIDPQALMEALDKWLGRTPEPPPTVPASPESKEPLEGPPIFDRKALKDRLLGDEDLVREICIGFLTDMTRQMQKLRQHIDQCDGALAGEQLHTIKGAAANVGGMALSAAALTMENAAKADRWDKIVPLMSKMERQFDILKTRMEKDFS
jgi:CheY-like chemotaxis protein/HPt (histidine-containing phosphotransfer) domain-containing protein